MCLESVPPLRSHPNFVAFDRPEGNEVGDGEVCRFVNVFVIAGFS